MSLTNPVNSETATGYGAFRIGHLHLALPLADLREAIPLRQLSAFPHGTDWLIGTIHVRGVEVPVMDLLRLLGGQHPTHRDDCILLLTHQHRMIGVLSSQVNSLFFQQSSNVWGLQGTDHLGRLSSGTLVNPSNNTTVFLLCVQALFELPGVISVEDPEPQRQGMAQANREASITSGNASSDTPMLLLNNSGVLYAINPSDIETTIPKAVIQDSDLAGGYFKGHVDFRGKRIPAICLSEYLGFGTIKQVHRQPQALVLKYPSGELAILIDQIVDIVRIDLRQAIELPPLPQLRQDLMSSVIPNSLLYPDKPDQFHHHVLNASGFLADPALAELAAVVHQAETERQPGIMATSRTQQTMADDQRMIIFHLHGLFAVPISEVTEVLPYRGIVEGFPKHQPLRGFLTHREHAIPVYDLAQTLGLERQHLQADSNVIVIDQNQRLIGYAVGQLTSIEQPLWSPTVPVLGTEREARYGPVRSSQRMVEVTLNGQRQLIECLSLAGLNPGGSDGKTEPNHQTDRPQSLVSSETSTPGSNASCEWY